jgi:aspartate-semialdehyde dehydrogenase
VFGADDPGKDFYPSPLETAGRDEVSVGRIRRAPGWGWFLFLCSPAGDNLRKALNGLQIAEPHVATSQLASGFPRRQ